MAQASGFADQHHLARVFRRITGVTPGSYRRSL
jgi:AraC family transcriptional regulator